MVMLVVLALILAKVDATQLSAFGGVLLAAVALYRVISIDPRASRMAERKENEELLEKVDELYRGKRDAEDRERDALRRLDRAERLNESQRGRIDLLTDELANANARIGTLEADVRKWRMIAGDIRGEGR